MIIRTPAIITVLSSFCSIRSFYSLLLKLGGSFWFTYEFIWVIVDVITKKVGGFVLPFTLGIPTTTSS